MVIPCRQRARAALVSKWALVELDEHAGTQDVELRPVTTPPALVVTVKPCIGTVVKPPAALSISAVLAATQVVVLVRSAELHPVAVPMRQARLGQHVSGVSAESRQAQSILVSIHLGPDLQNISRQSYDYLTIMPKLRSTYDGRLIYTNILRRAQGFS